MTDRCVGGMEGVTETDQCAVTVSEGVCKLVKPEGAITPVMCCNLLCFYLSLCFCVHHTVHVTVCCNSCEA